ncbi:MAG TPA: hypothetical protein VKE71_02295 [Candidatus Angelobacter sp.]|nr:hypothetical protein [Candidatus Angelobacter sp.]
MWKEQRKQRTEKPFRNQVALVISNEQMDNAIKQARDAFRDTFGEQALEEAIKPPPDDKDKTKQPK